MPVGGRSKRGRQGPALGFVCLGLLQQVFLLVPARRSLHVRNQGLLDSWGEACNGVEGQPGANTHQRPGDQGT